MSKQTKQTTIAGVVSILFAVAYWYATHLWIGDLSAYYRLLAVPFGFFLVASISGVIGVLPWVNKSDVPVNAKYMVILYCVSMFVSGVITLLPTITMALFRFNLFQLANGDSVLVSSAGLCLMSELILVLLFRKSMPKKG